MDNNELYKEIGSRIREVRLQQGLNQAELSKRTNISLPHISDIELGKTKMQLGTFTKIIEALQVSADVLIRPDIPQVNALYQREFCDVISDCTPSELEAIITIASEVKKLSRKAKAGQESW